MFCSRFLLRCRSSSVGCEVIVLWSFNFQFSERRSSHSKFRATISSCNDEDVRLPVSIVPGDVTWSYLWRSNSMEDDKFPPAQHDAFNEKFFSASTTLDDCQLSSQCFFRSPRTARKATKRCDASTFSNIFLSFCLSSFSIEKMT